MHVEAQTRAITACNDRGFGGHAASDNDPDVLQKEQERNLKGTYNLQYVILSLMHALGILILLFMLGTLRFVLAWTTPAVHFP